MYQSAQEMPSISMHGSIISSSHFTATNSRRYLVIRIKRHLDKPELSQVTIGLELLEFTFSFFAYAFVSHLQFSIGLI